MCAERCRAYQHRPSPVLFAAVAAVCVSGSTALVGRVDFTPSAARDAQLVAVTFDLGSPPADAASGGNDYVALYVPATAECVRSRAL